MQIGTATSLRSWVFVGSNPTQGTKFFYIMTTVTYKIEVDETTHPNRMMGQGLFFVIKGGSMTGSIVALTQTGSSRFMLINVATFNRMSDYVYEMDTVDNLKMKVCERENYEIEDYDFNSLTLTPRKPGDEY